MSTSKIALIVLGVALLLAFVAWGVWSDPSRTASSDDSGDSNSPIVYYYGRECSHCKDLEKFLEENRISEKVSFAKKEVWHNSRNSKEMMGRAEKCGIPEKEIGVPFIWDDGKCFIGGPDAEKFFREKAGIES